MGYLFALLRVAHFILQSIDYVDQAGIGIYIVYKVRNKFAHGEVKFPYPEDYAGERAFDVDIMDTATRLVLMTIQILLLNDIKDENIVFDSDSFLKDATGKTALEYLKSLHIAPDSE